jgi:N-acetylneuraminic acid mutarotase
MHRCFRWVVVAATTTALVVGTGTAPPAALAAGAKAVAEAATGGDAGMANTFVPTAPMHARRAGATATVLGDGDVLIAGGGTASAELYHPKSGTWSLTASMSTARSDATVTLLQDGDVLVAGGCCQRGNPYRGLSTAELYDPTTGTWSLTGSLNVPRYGDTATLLQNGEVLVAGGSCNGTAYGCDAGSFLYNLKSAELFNPSTGVWTRTGSMRFGREFQTATLLGNGEVLVAGGFNSCDDDFCTDLSSAELYDPVTGRWLHTASMSAAREQQTATLLPDGDVLVAGGLNEGGDSGLPTTYASAELYNPIFARWSPTRAMNHARAGQTATLLNGGWVLVAGGGSSTSEAYQPTPGIWVSTGDLSTARTDPVAASLANGDVLVAGGQGPDQEPLATAEVYQAGAGPLVRLSAGTVRFPPQQVGTTGDGLSFSLANDGTGPLDVAGVSTAGQNPSDFRATSTCGRQPVAPGASCTVIVRFAPLFQGLRTGTVTVTDNAPLTPQAVNVTGYAAGPNVWVPTGSMSTPRANFSSTLLTSGQVLVAGGLSFFDNTVTTAELFDPATGSFSPTGSLNSSRELQAAARLPNGDVLVAGGYRATATSAALLASAEIYNPATGSWTPTGSMNVASDGLTANLLDNGLVLVTGFNGSNPELYDPASGTWSQTGPLPSAGPYGLVALLHSGLVLLTGGPEGASALYDPATNTWAEAASLDGPRFGATATVLHDGDVLVVGGLPGNGGNALSSATLYNPTTNTWTATTSLPAGRYGQSAALLPNGSVVVAGGCDVRCENGRTDDATYVYAEGFWGQTASLPTSRYGQSATVLQSGDLLLAGGEENDSSDATPTAESYLPALTSAAPGRASTGQRITVTGRNFYAHETVMVSLSGLVFKVLGHPTTDSTGGFEIQATVPDAPAGTYQLGAQGQKSFAFARNTFVVRRS